MRCADRQPLDGDDHVGGLDVAHGNRTGPLHLAVDVDRAGAALGDTAAVFGAGQTNLLPNNPKKGRVSLDWHISYHSVDIQFCHGLPPSIARSITAWRAFAYNCRS